MDAPSILSFLKELQKNNQREWFLENKLTYTMLRKQFEDFVNQLICGINEFDKEIGLLTAKDCIFRINRDIRFSNDKSPYKNNFGAYITKGGRKSPFAGYYFHIEPRNSMLSGGCYIPRPEILRAIREEIYQKPDEFLALINDKNWKKNFQELDGEKLQGTPKGFNRDFPQADLLKYKSYVMYMPINDKFLANPNLLKNSLEVFKTMYSMNAFINKSIEHIA
jgi:uncharacterized protein (TIGR02453 family)